MNVSISCSLNPLCKGAAKINNEYMFWTSEIDMGRGMKRGAGKGVTCGGGGEKVGHLVLLNRD